MIATWPDRVEPPERLGIPKDAPRPAQIVLFGYRRATNPRQQNAGWLAALAGAEYSPILSDC